MRMVGRLLCRYAELLALAEARHAIVMSAYRVEDDMMARNIAAGVSFAESSSIPTCRLPIRPFDLPCGRILIGRQPLLCPTVEAGSLGQGWQMLPGVDMFGAPTIACSTGYQ